MTKGEVLHGEGGKVKKSSPLTGSRRDKVKCGERKGKLW